MSRPTALHFVTCPFGKPGSWAAGYHPGIDYRAPVGTEIYATRRGKVVFAGTTGGWGSAYGKHVIVESKHEGKKIRHLYAHMSKPYVKTGQRVLAGEFLGLSGETGNTFGPHLHYEERVSPFRYGDHIKPVLPDWYPAERKQLNRIIDSLMKRFKV